MRRAPPQLVRFDEQLERVLAQLQLFDELDQAATKVGRSMDAGPGQAMVRIPVQKPDLKPFFS